MSSAIRSAFRTSAAPLRVRAMFCLRRSSSLRVRVISSRSPSLSQTRVRRGAETSSASDICRCVTCGFDATSIRIVKSMRRSWNGSPIRFWKILKLGIAACARL